MTRARWLLAALIGLASRSRASEAILNVTLVVIECADARLPLLEASCRTWIPSFPHVVAYTDTGERPSTPCLARASALGVHRIAAQRLDGDLATAQRKRELIVRDVDARYGGFFWYVFTEDDTFWSARDLAQVARNIMPPVPEMTTAEHPRVIAAFLDKYVIDDALEEELRGTLRRVGAAITASERDCVVCWSAWPRLAMRSCGC